LFCANDKRIVVWASSLCTRYAMQSTGISSKKMRKVPPVFVHFQSKNSRLSWRCQDILFKNITIISPVQSTGVILSNQTTPMRNVVFEDVRVIGTEPNGTEVTMIMPMITTTTTTIM
jgi:hypothetical protein